jgi:hypothetical protein
MGEEIFSSRGGETTAVAFRDEGLPVETGFGFGQPFGQVTVKAIGGRYPDRMWAVRDASTRMNTSSELAAGSAKDAQWTVLVASGNTDNGPNAPPLHDFLEPIALPDGSHLVPESVDDRNNHVRYGFRLLDAKGALVSSAKVPGPDLARLAFDQRFAGGGALVVLDSGEVLGIRTTAPPKLVRWSPVKAVDDLPLPPHQRLLAMRATKKRAFVRVDDDLWEYGGEGGTGALRRARIAPKLLAGFELTTGEEDTLWVTTTTTLITDRGGVISEEPLPTGGRAPKGRVGTKELWLSGNANAEPALYRHTATGWQPVTLPTPPFGNASRGPLGIEGFTIAGDGDVLVNARRIEKGWGWKTTEPYRIIYRTKRPTEVLRCQDVRLEATGRGLWSWPPSADDGCTTPFVTVLREELKVPPKSYPEIAAKLRGKTEFGATLTFVDFEGKGSLNVGIPMTDVALARKLATFISQSLDYRADVVCGRPTAVRELGFDVAKGTFSK